MNQSSLIVIALYLLLVCVFTIKQNFVKGLDPDDVNPRTILFILILVILSPIIYTSAYILGYIQGIKDSIKRSREKNNPYNRRN